MTRRPWLLLLLLPLIPLFNVIRQGHTIGPFDQLAQMAPWRQEAPTQPWDVLQADGALQFYVWRDLVLDSWSKFQAPLWNPYQLAGTPLMANSQSAGLYPPNVLLGIIQVPTPLGVIVLAWLHLALAGLGVFRLVRALGGSELGALFAGSSFMLTPFLVGWTVLASVPATVAWIPWALALLTEAMRGHSRRFLGLGGAVAMMALAGHLQFLAYGMLALLVWGVFLAVEVRALRPILAAVLAVAGGLMLAGPQLMPVLDNSKYSHRRNTPSEEGYQAYVFSALRPFELGNMVSPLALGNPRTREDDAHISTYWPALVKRGGNWAEAAVSPGAVVVAGLCFLPLVFRRMRKSAAAPMTLGVVALLLALGTPLNRVLYFGVPGWSSTGSPGRVIVLFVMMAAVVAGLVATHLLNDQDRRSPRLVQLSTVVFALVAIGTMGLGMTGAVTPAGIDHGLFHLLVQRATSDAAFGLLMIAALAVQPFIYIVFRGGMIKQTGIWLFAIAAVATAVLGGIATTIPSAKPLAYTAEPSFKRIATINDGWDLLLAAKRSTLPPNTASLFRIHDLAGYDSLLHRDTVAMLNDLNGQDSAPQANGNIMFIKPQFDPVKLGEAGVTEVWSSAGLPGLEAGDADNGVFRQPIPGPGRVSSTGGSAEITDQTLRSITVRATGPGTLTLRDRNMPGWTASIGGQAVPILGDLWREVELPAGESTVEFRYTPPGWSMGWIMFVIGLLAAIGASRIVPAPLGEAQGTEEPSESADEEELAIA